SPDDGGQLDAALAGDAARERRRLDAAASVDRAAKLSDLIATGCLTAALAFWLRRRSRGAFLLHVVGDRRRLDLFARLADHRDRPPHLDLAALNGDLQQHSGCVRFDLLRHLVRVELVERLALLDLVAFGLQPLDDRPRLHPLSEARKLDLSRYRGPPF